jgi:hypothetical protein
LAEPRGEVNDFDFGDPRTIAAQRGRDGASVSPHCHRLGLEALTSKVTPTIKASTMVNPAVWLAGVSLCFLPCF